MSAALECWSGRPSTDEDLVEQVLMKTSDRSELSFPSSSPPSPLQSQPLLPKKWQRIGRNLASSALAALKNSLSSSSSDPPSPSNKPDDLHWSSLLRNLRHLYPNSHLPEKLLSDLRRHFDSLPTSYSLAAFDVHDVLLHLRLIEQSATLDHPALQIQELPNDLGDPDDGGAATVFKLTFAATSPFSWPALSGSLDTSLISCKKIQIFEKKGLTLGAVTVSVQSGGERSFKSRIESAVRSAVKKPRNAGVKLPFGLCGCQEEASRNADDEALFDGDGDQRSDPADSSPVVMMSVDERQPIRSGGEEIQRWMINPNEVEFLERTGSNSFRGVYRGKKVWIKKLKGCDGEIEIRQDLLRLMSCGQRNLVQFHGFCIGEESNGMCVVTRLMEGGSVHDSIQRNKKMAAEEAVRVALDVAEGLMFMNGHGVAYRDINTQRILLDRQGNACLGDMGIVTSCCNAGEVTEYETAGYRWLAPEIIAGDPESVTETWMSNVYSFGMVVWEMVTGEAAYSSYSPVQAAVGIAACGLRPDIPKDCPQVLRSLMMKCWNSCPSKRPQFSEIVAILKKQNNR